MIPLTHILILACLIFSLGLLGALLRKNLLMILLSIEIMLNAAAFAILGVSSYFLSVDGHVMFILILVIAAAEVAVGLGLVIRYFDHYRSLNIDDASSMKG